MKYLPLFVLGCMLMASCTSKQTDTTQETTTPPVSMDSLATAYVQLVLNIGQYNPDYVDAYYGPDSLKPDPQGKQATFPAETLGKQVETLLSKLESIEVGNLSASDKARHHSLLTQLIAVQAEINILSGKKYSFDEESKLLYNAVAPTHTEAHFQQLIQDLDKALPGKGTVTDRLNEYKKGFVIPKQKLDTVFKAAIAEARKRTLPQVDLPSNENFTVEYVTNKAWSGYNWYKGNSFSLIQVNTDLPIYIDRAIDLACHEGYPGHHVYNALMEKNLVRGNNWIEFSVYPLFSPQSLIAEGSANYGIDVAFPGEERVGFERDVLFPLAGLPKEKAADYYRIQDLTKGLSYAGNEAARQYLDGKITREAAADWLVKYGLMAPDRAKQRMDFIDKYRSYVINYNYGQDLVKQYVEKNGGTAQNTAKRWELFKELLSNPHTPSQLQ
ncbi:hypothetical protein Q0590_20400 [Rhodocytophaga aerolata]|uniref:DUF885 domain-containing protein n=1 Tax=Rhodocytophaga aerolata TaxID=455078 RepID=A0ABT8R991_9BACT|nr:hypothetical protein [Rhodocytophaga aerolata]MDO1448650.1 hypothetical protein [Rhodocytophaga aerolata]